ncbi:uncharacterized protein LOC134212037 [Armigeres subalbatus]|uniref:uncharacterized protein LOC134212037 n=1 Tax=Armigeres subalbatus TaxID=124917 RepID=UPI002ED0CE1D
MQNKNSVLIGNPTKRLSGDNQTCKTEDILILVIMPVKVDPVVAIALTTKVLCWRADLLDRGTTKYKEKYHHKRSAGGRLHSCGDNEESVEPAGSTARTVANICDLRGVIYEYRIGLYDSHYSVI